MNNFTNALGLDVGSARIGVARVNSIARLPEALKVLPNDAQVSDALRALIHEYQIDLLVVGLPRNMQGETTEQSRAIQEFTDKVVRPLQIPVVYQDETLSSVEADSRVATRSKKIGQDAVAAQIILEYFLEAHPVQ